MDSKKDPLFSSNDPFWSDIHRYIDSKKAEIENQRQQSRHHASAPRKCPNCQKSMGVTDFNQVFIDLCSHCGGVFLDKGELELLFKTQHKEGFIESLKRFFGHDDKK